MPRLQEGFSTSAATPKIESQTSCAAQLLAETSALVVDEPLHTRQEISLQTLHVILSIDVRHGLGAYPVQA